MMTPRYKAGDLFRYNRTEIDELIIIVKYDGISNINSVAEFERNSHCYSCYNLTFDMYIERTEKFLDMYYEKLA